MARSALNKVLLDIGLDESEACIYLAALASGPSSVASIASAAGVKRTTAYTILEKLQSRGLISQELKGFKRLYAATSPEFLESVLMGRLSILRESMPQFLSIFNQRGNSSVIKYFDGLAAVKTVYEKILRSARPKEPYDVLSNTDQWYALDPNFFSRFIELRGKKMLTPRHILSDSPTTRRYASKVIRLGGTIKYLPPKITLSVNMVITPKMLVLHQLIPPIYAVVIESSTVIEMMQKIYEIVWQSLPGESR